MDLVCAILQIYFLILLGTIIMSWIPTSEGSGADRAKGVLRSLTEPVLSPVRRMLPPVQMGTMGLDLSPTLVLLGLLLLQQAICGP